MLRRTGAFEVEGRFQFISFKKGGSAIYVQKTNKNLHYTNGKDGGRGTKHVKHDSDGETGGNKKRMN